MPPKPTNSQAPGAGADARCEYHIGGIRHWTNDCYHLRHRIQDLLDRWVFIYEGGMRITLRRIHVLHCRMNQRVVVYARRERRPRYNHPFHSKI